MKELLRGIASLGALVLVAGIMVGGFYLRSMHTPRPVGQAAEVSPSPADTPSDSPTPTDMPSPSPTAVAPPIAPSPAPAAPAPANLPPHPAPTCPPEVITSFTATAAPNSVVLRWTVSGGCGDETGSIGGQYAGTTYPVPGYWVIQIHRAWQTYTDHPQKPANSQGVCLFSLDYDMVLNGTAPDGRGVHAVFAQVSNVNLC